MDFRRHAGAGARAVATALLLAPPILASLAVRASAQDAAAPPVAVAARLADDGESAKITLRPLGAGRGEPPTRWPTPTASSSTSPRSTSSSIRRSAARRPGRGGALVKAFRFGLFGPGRSRVVVDLARPACVEKTETAPIAKERRPASGHCVEALRVRRLRRGGARRAPRSRRRRRRLRRRPSRRPPARR